MGCSLFSPQNKSIIQNGYTKDPETECVGLRKGAVNLHLLVSGNVI